MDAAGRRGCEADGLVPSRMPLVRWGRAWAARAAMRITGSATSNVGCGPVKVQRVARMRQGKRIIVHYFFALFGTVGRVTLVDASQAVPMLRLKSPLLARPPRDDRRSRADGRPGAGFVAFVLVLGRMVAHSWRRRLRRAGYGADDDYELTGMPLISLGRTGQPDAVLLAQRQRLHRHFRRRIFPHSARPPRSCCPATPTIRTTSRAWTTCPGASRPASSPMSIRPIGCGCAPRSGTASTPITASSPTSPSMPSPTSRLTLRLSGGPRLSARDGQLFRRLLRRGWPGGDRFGPQPPTIPDGGLSSVGFGGA